MTRTRFGLLAIALVLLATAAGCAGGAQQPVATFTARDFSFSGPETVPAGFVRFELVNAGSRAHMLGIVSLGDGRTADDLLKDVRDHANAPFPAYATQLGGPDAVDPGAESIAYADLKPGHYAVFCQMPDGDTGHSHLDLGMIRSFTVTGSGPTESAPEVSGSLDATDFSFKLDKPLAAGSQTFQVRNSGRQQHEAQLARLPTGVSVNQYIALNDATSITAGASYGGLAPIPAGTNGYFNAYFTPGSYAFICFVTDPQTGKAHFELGQTLEFTVR